MAIENFTKEQFQAALPCDKSGAPLWTAAGIDAKSNQWLYTVTPFPAFPAFAILIYSSIQSGGASSATAGKDSIRAIITYNGAPHGGKNQRWIDRRPKWQARLLKALRALAHQISWLKLSPCPCCKSVLVPFTSGTEANPGRTFVKCCNQECAKPFYAWCENEAGEPIAAALPAALPPCPDCGAAIAKSKFNGAPYYCTAYKAGCKWKGELPTTTEQGEPQAPVKSISLAEAKREQERLRHDGTETAAMCNSVGQGDTLAGFKATVERAKAAGKIVIRKGSPEKDTRLAEALEAYAEQLESGALNWTPEAKAALHRLQATAGDAD